MKKVLLIVLAVLFVVPVVSAQNKDKKGKKVVSPIIEGRQKVRQTDYDSVWKFTTFDNKKKYYCNFDYTQVMDIVAQKKPDWGAFKPVMNYLLTVPRAPLRICAVFALNPNITNEDHRNALIDAARYDAKEAYALFTDWAQEQEMKNKFSFNVAQVDYRYWKGNDYFLSEPPTDDIIVVGYILYFGTKKIDLFPNATANAQTFKDIKFFPNDATIVDSYIPVIDSLASYLKANDNYEVLLTGYTDNQGTPAYCTGLARQRAVEIKKQLLKRGIAEYKIEIDPKGSADPIGDNETYEGRIANNRVAIKIQ
ncbi:MAG: OmpA family protein [Bacteroidales bacterium]|jgi:outer membrane protein OmpA-like peptidoglycan-associated protein|nr:OmpA family protein [Bacteroidales bacterium]